MTTTQESMRADKLKRGVEQKKIAYESLQKQLSSTGTDSVTLASGAAAVFSSTLVSKFALPLFGTYHCTLYETQVDSAHKIPEGGSVSQEYRIAFWFDWGDTNNNNIVQKAYIRNETGAQQTILFRNNWRFFVEEPS